ncbi:DUF445 domain-containing protein [Tepidibacillus infernus]|uniref:DUF445 domain-containing protein n=1 Tax=Tepidibacillus infernus TaxID=1806172 RepID=UPI003B6AB9A2
MFFIMISIGIGALIGAFTNALAIKMLFRPFKSWKIGSWQVPFTPGLIPKRRSEIAEQLGHMVENYLFTAEGLKQFIEKSGIRNQLLEKLQLNIQGLVQQNQTVKEMMNPFLSEEWEAKIKGMIQQKALDYLSRDEVRAKSLADFLSEPALIKIEDRLGQLSQMFIQEIKDFLHSFKGKVWLDSIVKQLFEGKRMIGFLAGMLLEGEQIQQKLLSYFDQILEKPDTQQVFQTFLVNEWNQMKEKPIGDWLDDFDPILHTQLEEILDKGLEKAQNLPFQQVIDLLNKHNFLERAYHWFFELFQEKMDKIFSYLSIAEVVKTEVNAFSLEEFEKMILEITNRELKMITYLGGVLGGFIGLFQGVLFLFFK